MKKFFSILLMFLISFTLSAVNVAPTGSPPTEKQTTIVQPVFTVDKVVNHSNYAVVDVGFSYCVEKQSIEYTFTKMPTNKSCIGYFYTDKDYGSRWVKSTNNENKFADNYSNRLSWSIGGCTNISPPLPSFTNPIIT